MKCFAGDLEQGDRVLSGQVLAFSTRHGGFRAEMLEHESIIADVLDEHPHNPRRVMVKLMSGQVLDLHRTWEVNVL